MTPLCGAKARLNGGRPCKRPAGPNGRCSNHGGRSTGPKTTEGKEKQRQSVWKHGYWSKDAIAERRLIKKIVKQSKNMLA